MGEGEQTGIEGQGSGDGGQGTVGAETSPHPDPLPGGEGDREPSEAERLRGEVEAARAEALAARGREVAAHRRALLAENAGKVVPELVAGDTVEALEASVEVARAAHEAVRQATMAEVAASARVGVGNGTRGNPVDVEAMSPMQKIAYGLKPARE